MEICGGALLRERVEHRVRAGETRFAISDAHRVRDGEKRGPLRRACACAADAEPTGRAAERDRIVHGETGSRIRVVGNVGRTAIAASVVRDSKQGLKEWLDFAGAQAPPPAP